LKPYNSIFDIVRTRCDLWK